MTSTQSGKTTLERANAKAPPLNTTKPSSEDPEDSDEAASIISGLSLPSQDDASVVLADDWEEEKKALKKKTVPMRSSGREETFVQMWVRPSEECSPQENLRVALVKVVTVVTSVD